MISSVLDHAEGRLIEPYSIKRYLRNHDADQLWIVDVDVIGDRVTRWQFLVHATTADDATRASLTRLQHVHGGDWRFDPIECHPAKAARA